MDQNCIFCKIINKEIPSDIVYEDDSVVAFLDIKPVSAGHVLVLPKKHTPDFLEADDELLRDLMPKVKTVADAVMKAVKAEGMNITVNNKPAAGQIIFHLHFHLIPRFSGDHLSPWPQGESKAEKQKSIAEEIRKNL